MTYCDSGKETLRDVSDDDSDKEDDSLKPVVLQDESQEEEGDSEEDSDSGDDVDEMFDLDSDRGL